MEAIRRARQWAAASPFAVDVVLAVMAWLLCVLVGGGASGDLALLLVTLQIAPLAWRRSLPFPAAAVIAAGCLLQLLVLDTPLLSNVAALAIIYAVAAYAPERWHTRTVVGIALAGAVLGAVDWVYRFPSGTASGVLVQLLPMVIFMWMSVGAAWALGDAVRRRRAVVARLREQNEALARDQAQRAALAAQGERATIAREMHDIVAHSLAVVVVQADGGAYAARVALDRGNGGDPAALERAAQTLETLASTAREALTDTRRLVGVLRESGSAAEFEPTQGLATIEELVQRVRDSGVPVELAVRGEVGRLPRELDLAAYRVVQESLTNVLKHAGPQARVGVDVLRTPAVLLVRVTDDGQGMVVADGQGNGIIGMRERVEFLGGTLHAGPRVGGGFEVVASVPVPATDEVPPVAAGDWGTTGNQR